MSNKYYQEELGKLRELAVEFSQAHPTLAPQLAGASPDPDVERILEGVAFLTGSIREKVDDDFPEFAQSLTQMIFPHYLRPLPSSTIIKFTPKNILKGPINIPAKTYVDSGEVSGVKCRFRTCYEVQVNPLEVTKVDVDYTGSSGGEVTVDLGALGVNLGALKLDHLRFYIGGDYVTAADFYLALVRHLESVELLVGGERHSLGRDCIMPKGFGSDDVLLPYPVNSFPAFRILQEYFHFKEKFLFVELNGLEDILADSADAACSLVFRFRKTDFNVPRVGKEQFQLHASPAVNLFEQNADPLSLDHRLSEIRLAPSREHAHAFQVYSVDEVTGIDRVNAERIRYQPLSVLSAELTMPVFQATHRESERANQVDTYLAFSYPPEYNIPESETMTLKLTCTNGNLPSKLRPGEISKPTSNTSELVDFGNLLPPCETQQPPVDDRVVWRLVSHLALNFLKVSSTENLKALLDLYIFPGSSKAVESNNRKRVAGITGMSTAGADRLVEGSVVRGQEIVVTLNREHFSCQGDMYLFGAMVEHLLTSFSPVNTFVAVTVGDEHTGNAYDWPARLGDTLLT